MVHVFVSYSRRDREFVARIVDRLEASGHDVWIDTDDIVGSDRWRASIGEAIARADVVVLVVSPASMSSKNVEREITVAAEEDRRIIPVEIEPAEVPVGLLYDLAGVQRTTFVDRSFDDGVADLLAAIADTPAARSKRRPSSPPQPSPSEGRDPKGRRGRWKAMAAVPVVAGLVVAAIVLRQAADNPAETVALDSVVSTTSPPSIDATDVDLDATVWFAGYTVEATRARYDPTDATVSVDVQFTNDQFDSGDPCDLLLEDIALVVDGTRTMLWADPCTRLSPGTSTRTTLTATVSATTGGPVGLDQAVVEFGAPDQHQATIPLDGRPATSDFPVTAAATGTVTGEVTTFTLETVEVVPAGCSSSNPIRFPPGRLDEMSVVVTGTATSASDYPVGYGKARLTLPDGTDLASNSLAGVIYALDPGIPTRDIRACFVVPAPVAGEYPFTIASDGDEPFPEPITLTF